ncbi:MAG: ABC transporter ATP-binding protein/permease [Clostridiales bacterium]|nr:ABC transporter ATP-binding protein/permease [Clostridiales bacterium]
MTSFLTLKDFFIANKWKYILGVLWLVVVDLLQLAIPEVLRRFTDKLQNNLLAFDNVLFYGLIIIGIGISIAVFRFLWRIFIIGTSRELQYYLRNRLFSHLLTLSPDFYNRSKTGELMALSLSDIGAVIRALGMGLVLITDSILITVVAITMMLTTTDLKLTLFALIPLLFLVFIISKFGNQINSRSKQVQKSIASLTDTVQENFSGIRVVKSYVQEKEEIHKFGIRNQMVFNEKMYLVRIFGMFFPIIQLLSALSFVVAIGYGGFLVVNESITLGDFIAFNAYLNLLVWPMMAMGWVVNVMQRGAASMDRINKILDETPAITDAVDAQPLNTFNGDIVFDCVTMNYPNSNINSLNNFSLRIPAGTSLGVIGKTGSGKTSIATLLLRLYEPSSGTISIDGKLINKLTLSSLRNHIGYVDQDSFLFSDTVANNIAFAVDSFTQSDIEKAAEISNIHKNIMNFPDQYETFIGERGVNLSGGQKQRISIARCLMKKPSILILDDSLSAVDTETEKKIIDAINLERKNKTNIIISHRISTIKDCDHIIVLDNGSIFEQGTHETLLKNNSLYNDFYQKQLLREKIDYE